MEIVVQKFGGTSVATNELRENVANIVLNKKNEGFLPVVVVSAMGRKGAPYATDTLVNVAKESNPEIEPRELDLIMSCGEIISCVVLANLLQSKGIKSVALTGGQAGIITDSNYGNAEVIRVEPDKILGYLKNDIVPIVSGFQGISEDGDVTTLGRGGSDTTASIIGEALRAKYVEIYTDVDGIMTADPKLVPHAKVIPQMSYHEVFQIADEGAKVIHPKSVQIAMRANIPLVIKNTFNVSDGTYIAHSQYNYKGKRQKDKVVSGIAHISNRAQVFIQESKIDDVELFDTLANNCISVDLINVFEDRKVFTINESEVAKFEKIFSRKKLEYNILSNCTKISIVGDRMRGVPGVMAKFMRALGKAGIKVLQSADSHTTISCLIKTEDVAKAVSAVHDEFELAE